MTNSKVFLQMYRDVANGLEIFPRDLRCREVTDYMFQLDMSDDFITNFKARKMNLTYAMEEFKWYLGADKFDTSIEQYATMWQKIRQPDGSYFSNYGQYIFPDQFMFVIDELSRDPDSRRASIVLLKPEHLFRNNKDIVCTYAINFRIRRMKLDMTVLMRSNDVIFGTTNDVFCFSMLYRMIFAIMAERSTLRPGTYSHFTNSLHVYERHFDMIEQILKDGQLGFESTYVPWATAEEAMQTVLHGYNATRGHWSAWMT
jgi:thymidylate synthase